jgi:hypothetical protein
VFKLNETVFCEFTSFVVSKRKKVVKMTKTTEYENSFRVRRFEQEKAMVLSTFDAS